MTTYRAWRQSHLRVRLWLDNYGCRLKIYGRCIRTLSLLFEISSLMLLESILSGCHIYKIHLQEEYKVVGQNCPGSLICLTLYLYTSGYALHIKREVWPFLTIGVGWYISQWRCYA